ncbi:MAG: ABC transporter substrate-binding protein [Actinomycetes bacterium]
MYEQHLSSALTRRRLLQALGLAGVGAFGAACAGPGASGGGSQNASSPLPTSAGPIEGDVSFAHWRAEDKEVLDKIIANFVKANPDVSIQQDIAPSNDYQSTALQQIRTGDIGDVFTSFRGAQFNDMVSAGLYSDLTGQPVVDRYQPELIATGADGDTQYGLPYQLVFLMAISNLELLEKAGATENPDSWDGFLSLCEDLLAQGVVPIAWPAGDPGNAGQMLNAMVMNNAPSDDMFAKIEAGEYKCTDDWFVKTLEQYAELRPYVQPNATGTAVEPAQQLFAQGQAGMLYTGSYHMAAVRGLGAQFPFGLIAPITTSASDATYEGVFNTTFILGVNTASDVQAAALAFVEYLSEPEVGSEYANGTGQFLTLADVTYDNPDLDATSDWLTRKTLLAPRFQFNDLDIRSAVEETAVKVVGGTDPAQAAEDAQRIIDQRIG